jgi:hypothetical protein
MNRSVIDNREKPGHRPRAAVTVRRASTAVNHARRSMAPNGSKVAGPNQPAEILLRNRNLKMARNAHAYDQAMPGMTGTELAEIVQQKRPDLSAPPGDRLRRPARRARAKPSAAIKAVFAGTVTGARRPIAHSARPNLVHMIARATNVRFGDERRLYDGA